MRKLEINELVAIVVSVFVVGFFFIFGQGLVSMFNGNQNANIKQAPQVTISDTLIGAGDVAVTGDSIIVNYVGHFTDGKVFDSSITRGEPYQFTLGSGQVIKGWDEGIPGMRAGGKRTITIPPELGYGASDYGPIPGNSTLVFDIELIKVIKK